MAILRIPRRHLCSGLLGDDLNIISATTLLLLLWKLLRLWSLVPMPCQLVKNTIISVWFELFVNVGVLVFRSLAKEGVNLINSIRVSQTPCRSSLSVPVNLCPFQCAAGDSIPQQLTFG